MHISTSFCVHFGRRQQHVRNTCAAERGTAVQGHERSLTLVAIEMAYGTWTSD